MRRLLEIKSEYFTYPISSVGKYCKKKTITRFSLIYSASKKTSLTLLNHDVMDQNLRIVRRGSHGRDGQPEHHPSPPQIADVNSLVPRKHDAVRIETREGAVAQRFHGGQANFYPQADPGHGRVEIGHVLLVDGGRFDHFGTCCIG